MIANADDEYTPRENRRGEIRLNADSSLSGRESAAMFAVYFADGRERLIVPPKMVSSLVRRPSGCDRVTGGATENGGTGNSRSLLEWTPFRVILLCSGGPGEMCARLVTAIAGMTAGE
ncbi:hypothetical protein ACFWY9_00090 [Amycolatopsis sp. NPDC059027]|uniref:hypothetical protein n=1 Tax=unclassified Amycolatopsis TaxID=2618356 RepID=UPI00366C897B